MERGVNLLKQEYCILSIVFTIKLVFGPTKIAQWVNELAVKARRPDFKSPALNKSLTWPHMPRYQLVRQKQVDLWSVNTSWP